MDDPIATSVDEYCRLVNLAHLQKVHLQNTTMFVYHYAVQEFLAWILDEEKFGEIRRIDACFDMNSKVTHCYGFASDERDGCIHDLCRYCAIMGLLIFQKSKRKALTAQIVHVARDDHGNPTHCDCRIQFEEVRASSFPWFKKTAFVDPNKSHKDAQHYCRNNRTQP